MEDTTTSSLGLGFHSHRDAKTGAVVAAVPAFPPSASRQQHYVTATTFVSSSINSENDTNAATCYSQTMAAETTQNQLPSATNNPAALPPTSTVLPIMQQTSQQPVMQMQAQMPIHQQQQEQQQQEEQHHDAIAKAREIAQRFHRERMTTTTSDTTATLLPSHYTSTTTLSNNNNYKLHNIINNIHNNNENYAQKRQQHFQNEHRKLQTYRLKNLEYIMKKEESELRSHVECMNEMTAWGERQSLHQQRQQIVMKEQQERKEQREMERQQRQLQMKVGGGIGSNDQRHVEVIRKRQLQHPNQQQQRQETPVSTTTPARTSIYLTNLPTDGSITERTLGSLFCTYGRLDRVTMYRDRSSGELKGDGLIVFGRDAIAATAAAQNRGDAADLVDIVCSQMNGAELPCGTVIGVEPADMDWGKNNGSNKKSKTSSSDHHHRDWQQQSPTVQVASNCGSDGVEMKKSNEASTEAAAEETIGGNDDEDLDDFFASLE